MSQLRRYYRPTSLDPLAGYNYMDYFNQWFINP